MAIDINWPEVVVGMALGVVAAEVRRGVSERRRRQDWLPERHDLLAKLWRSIVFVWAMTSNGGFTQPATSDRRLFSTRIDALHEILARGGPVDIRIHPSTLSPPEGVMLRKGIVGFREDIVDIDAWLKQSTETYAHIWTDKEIRAFLAARRTIAKLREWVPPVPLPPGGHDEGIELACAAEYGRDAMKALDDLMEFASDQLQGPTK